MNRRRFICTLSLTTFGQFVFAVDVADKLKALDSIGKTPLWVLRREQRNLSQY